MTEKQEDMYSEHKKRRLLKTESELGIIRKLFIIVNITTSLFNLTSTQVTATNPREPHPRFRASFASRILSDGESSATSGQPLIERQQTRTSELSEPLATTSGDPQPKLATNQETNALIYLQKYGYMTTNSNSEANNLISEDSFSNAVASFQRFAGITETGVIDEPTLHYMQLPRCGNVDKPSISKASFAPITALSRLRISLKRRKRYALQGSKWRRQELTYRISQYPTRFTGKRHEVDAQIEKAFGIWSQVAPIDFVVKKEGRVHIDIRFASGDHGDGDAFDGPGNTLAHAYFPQYGGDAHFDDQEFWTIDSYTGTNIFQVAAHELGHSLGLGHSNVREALMAPFYQKYKPNFKLHADDVLAIQALYGEKPFLLDDVPHPHSSAPQPQTTTTSTTTTTTQHPPPASTQVPNSSTAFRGRYPSILNNRGVGRNKPPIFMGGRPAASGGEHDNHEPTDDESPAPDANDLAPAVPEDGAGAPPDLCVEPTIDAVTRTEDGSTYVFRGEYYWLLRNDGLAKGYPRRISADWEGLPGSLDAALTWADGKTFFFKGNKYWRFKNKRRDVGYPKLISLGFAGIPDNIDAAFVWSGNGRTYIFKGGEYWRFDSKADPPVSSEYPRPIKVWDGVPAHINAAFRWQNNVTYFFKGSQYYRFNDKEFKVEPKGRPPFPRLSSEWWFGCISTNLAQRTALSSSLRDEPSGVQDKDWSFFAGLEENTKLMGTHISDQKPATFDPTNQRAHEKTRASSSAISRAQFNNFFISFASTTLVGLGLSCSELMGLLFNLVKAYKF